MIVELRFKKKKIKIVISQRDVMKQGVVSLLAQLMSQRRCKHNSLTLMRNRTTQTKNAWKGSLGSNPFPLWSGWYATQPTQPPGKNKLSLFLLPGTRHLNITYQDWQYGGTGQPTVQPLWIFFSVLYVVSNIWYNVFLCNEVMLSHSEKCSQQAWGSDIRV